MKMQELQLHPLINPNSKHYDTEEKTAIELLEEQLTVSEMIGFCKGNIFKYEYRKEHKGAKEDDEVKIKTYQDYLNVLNSTIGFYRSMPCVKAFFFSNIKFMYR